MTAKRLAILSATGTARKRTIPAIRSEDICDIVGIHGRDSAKLQILATEYGIPSTSTDAEKLLDQTAPDFVFIGSPPTMHGEQIKMCIDRGLPVLCEKPLCLSSGEIADLRNMVEGSDTILRVAHHLRHQPGVSFISEVIASQKYGRIRRISAQWGFWLNETAPNALWKLNPLTGGPDAFFDAGIHVVDLVYHLVPFPTKVVALVAHTRFAETNDHVSAVLSDGNTVSEFNASQSTPYAENYLTIDFEGATVSVASAFGEKSFTSLQLTSEDGATKHEFPKVNPYGEEIKSFIRSLEGEQVPCTTMTEAANCMAVVEAIRTSYLNGESVEPVII